MRFSPNGYYLEEYAKCANCGVLLYGEPIRVEIEGASEIYCSKWCVDWDAKRRRDEGTRPDVGSWTKKCDGAAFACSPEDMLAMTVLDSRLVQIAKEMGITLMKTSYSTIFNEGLDFTCGLADTKGNLIATGDFQPSMIGGLPLVIHTISQEIPQESLEPGDIIVHNDPYRGGMHTPEHTFVMPVFAADTFIGYSVAIGHVAEVGGMAPGAFASEATEIFHEGLRVPPVKIKRRGKDVDDIWKLMLANYRTPRQNYGDFRAMISAVELGAERYADTVTEYGIQQFDKTIANLLDYSEARMRTELHEFPSGIYSFEDFMEDDGISDRPYKIAAEVFIRDDDVIVDFRKTDGQAIGPINAVLSVAWAACYNAILHLTDPTIPKNSGCFRPIKIVAPPGRLVNADYPAAEVGGNTETHIRICHTVIGALSTAVPDRAFAADGGTHSNFLFGGYNTRTDEYIVCYDISVPGWGGRSHADGNNACNAVSGNSRLNPVEVFETRFPWRVDSHEFIADSGGPGKHRGGLALRKTLTCLADELKLSFMSDRQVNAPWGLFGGEAGMKGSIHIRRAGSDDWKDFREDSGKVSASKFSNAIVRRGDQVEVIAPAGGGYGDPSERDAEMIERDLRAGWITGCGAKGYRNR